MTYRGAWFSIGEVVVLHLNYNQKSGDFYGYRHWRQRGGFFGGRFLFDCLGLYLIKVKHTIFDLELIASLVWILWRFRSMLTNRVFCVFDRVTLENLPFAYDIYLIIIYPWIWIGLFHTVNAFVFGLPCLTLGKLFFLSDRVTIKSSFFHYDEGSFFDRVRKFKAITCFL